MTQPSQSHETPGFNWQPMSGIVFPSFSKEIKFTNYVQDDLLEKWQKAWTSPLTYLTYFYPNDLDISHSLFGTNLITHYAFVPSPTEPLKHQVDQRIAEYVHWYQTFIESYKKNLQEADEKDEERLSFGYEQGIPSLQELTQILTVQSESDVEALEDVLDGFQLMAGFVTDLDGRGELVIRLAENVIAQLQFLGLIGEESHRSKTFRYAFAESFTITFQALYQPSSQQKPFSQISAGKTMSILAA